MARVPAALPIVLGVSLACGRPPADQPEPLDGPDLVSGSSLVRYGLLVIPRRDGVAEFRSVTNPSAVRWTGRLTLGRVTAAYSLGASAVLRDGSQLRRYTTSPTEAVSPLPDVPLTARWIPSAAGGAFVAGDRMLVLTGTTASQLTAAGEILWAAPAAGDRVVALVEAEAGPELVVWEPGETTPSERRIVGTRGPVVLTGWGRQVVTASENGRGLTAWSIPGLEAGDGLAIGGVPSVLATTPSQHRVFAASVDRAQFVSIDRYDWSEVGSSVVEAPIEALRPGITGGRLLAFDGARAWSVRIGEAGLEALPGEWRSDLPLVLPGGGLLVSTEDGPGLLAQATGALEPVDGPVDAWWLPFRWGPRLPVASVAAAEDTIQDEEEALEALADSVPPTPDRIGLLTLRTPPGPRQALDQEAEAPPPDRAAAPATPSLPELAGGFYAVVISSRELSSLGQMRRLLDDSGYSTHVLRRLDEANDMWYRLLVGPYSSRSDAEAVARELRRERGIDAWIHEELDDQTERRRP